MSIASEITRLQTSKADVKTKVNIDKDIINGGTAFIGNETVDDYDDKIAEMQEAYKKFIPIQTASGTEIQLDNSSNDKALVDIGLDGNTEQTTTTGKNKLPSVNTTRTINGITFTHNEDGTITANGTASDNALYPIAINGTETGLKTVSLPAGTYRVVDGIGDYTNYFTQMTNGSSFWLNTGSTGTTGVSPTQTLDSTTDVAAFLYIRNGKTANNLIFKPMILLDSVTDLSYEPYTGRNCLS